MVAQQRLATFRLGLSIGMIIVFAAMVQFFGPGKAQAAWGLLALLAIEPFIFGRRKMEPWDERDRAIHLRSLQISFIVIGLVATAALWITYFAHQETGVIPIQLLASAAWAFWLALVIVQSTTILILYKLG